MKKMLNYLFFLLGIFCTMIIFKPYVFGMPFYVAYVITIVIIVLMLFDSKLKFNVSILKSKLFIFYYFTAISSMLSVFLLPNGWFSKSLSYAVQIITVWIPFLLLLNGSENRTQYKNYFIKGLKASIFIHAIWGTLEIILWNTLEYKLNEEILAKLVRSNITHQATSFTYINGDFYIRPSGINFEPAYFGILLLIGFFITNKLWIKGYYLILLFISLSRTSILGLILVIIYIFVKNINNRKFLIRAVFGILATTILIEIAILTSPQIKDRIDSALFRSNIANSDVNNDGTDRHLLYYPLSIPIMFVDSNLLQTLFGYGARISGYPFQYNTNIANKIGVSNFPPGWAVESDLIDVLVGNGLIGFVLYYSILLSNIKRIKDNNLYIGNLVLLICGITYGFYSLTFFNLILIFSEVEIFTINKSDKIKFKFIPKKLGLSE